MSRFDLESGPPTPATADFNEPSSPVESATSVEEDLVNVETLIIGAGPVSFLSSSRTDDFRRLDWELLLVSISLVDPSLLWMLLLLQEV